MNIKEVAEYVSSEGLGYSIESGISHIHIDDKELAKLWKDAEWNLAHINKILKKHFIEI